MTPEEKEAYNIMLLYEKEFLRIFQGEIDGQTFRRNTIPKRKNPKSGNLFRHCWKLRRETRGLLKDDEYELYIRANLTILKIHKAHVSPNAICGDRAWIRWKVWKRRYDQKMADVAAKPPPPSVSNTDPKIIRDLDRTKKFLFERCDGQPTEEKIKEFLDNGYMKMWIATAKVSQFYVLLSPWLRKHIKITELSQECGFDLKLLEGLATRQVKDYFSYEFSHEKT